MPPKILITGATGFLGSHLAEVMSQSGIPIRTLVRSTSKVQLLTKLGVELHEGSLEDTGSLRRAVQGCTAVIHCAGAIKVRRNEDFESVNAGGTHRLLEACAAEPGLQRFVQVSSISAHGPSDTSAPRPVDSEPKPVSAYGRSKLAAEREVLRYADRFSIAIVRPPAIYGPRDPETFPFFRFASWGILPVIGDSSSLLSMIYATDAAQALALCATSPALPPNAVYSISDGNFHSWVEVGQSMAAVFGKRGRPVSLPLGLFSAAAALGGLYGRLSGKAIMLTADKVEELRQKYWICDNSRIQKDLGFEPNVALTEGIPLAVDWYRQNGWL